MNVTNHERATLILRINLQRGKVVLQTHHNEFLNPSAIHRDVSLELELWFLFLAQWLPLTTIVTSQASLDQRCPGEDQNVSK
jgi:hypothetical protein